MSSGKRKNPFPNSEEEPPVHVSKSRKERRSVADEPGTSTTTLAVAASASGASVEPRPIRRAVSRVKSQSSNNENESSFNERNDTSGGRSYSQFWPRVGQGMMFFNDTIQWRMEHRLGTYLERATAMMFNDFRYLSLGSTQGNYRFRPPARNYTRNGGTVSIPASVHQNNRQSALNTGTTEYNTRAPQTDIARFTLSRPQSDIVRFSLPRPQNIVTYSLFRPQRNIVRFSLPRPQRDFERFPLTPRIFGGTYGLPFW